MVITGCRVGEIYPGGYSQFVKVKSEFLVKIPKTISNKNAMILGTAGFTSLLCAFAIKAREELLLGEKVNDVLVTGATGGCLLYTSPSPRDATLSRMPSSA